jgi:hypothetical protein
VYRAVQKHLTPQVYDFIQTIQQPGQADSQPTQTHANIAKEEQIIPDIIYQIEEFEKQLIQLSSKGAFHVEAATICERLLMADLFLSWPETPRNALHCTTVMQ